MEDQNEELQPVEKVEDAQPKTGLITLEELRDEKIPLILSKLQDLAQLQHLLGNIPATNATNKKLVTDKVDALKSYINNLLKEFSSFKL